MRVVLRQLGLVLLMLTILAMVYPNGAASSTPMMASAASASQIMHNGVQIMADGTLQLQGGFTPPRVVARSYQHYGFYLAAPQLFSMPIFAVRLTYTATVPIGSAVQIDLRTSTDGQTWSAWETDLTNGAIIDFPGGVRQTQYRARLLGTQAARPQLHAVQVQPVAAPARFHALSDDVAPTYRIRATRLGMIGGRTANGHIIRPRDRFVALPSWRSLSSRGGHEYQVRITYKGRSVVAPVWDVGPWNTRDDYWSVQRERFPELRRGWPQDHAAYFERHNGGYAEKGYVRFPTAMDVGDGIWWDDLGIVGDQAEVEVTFLWEGRDPLTEPPPPPAIADIEIDTSSPDFQISRSIWHHSPPGCGAGGHAFWTLTTTNPDASTHRVRWQPALPVTGMYDVYVHVPRCEHEYPITTAARYLVQHREGVQEILINQAQQTDWVLLGRFAFADDNNGFIQLTSLAGDAGHTLWFDNARWVFAGW